MANLALCATCLSSGLTRCFGFGGHGSLQLDGEAGIFAAKENGVTAHDLMLLYNCGIAWAWKWAALGNGGQRWVAAVWPATWCHIARRALRATVGAVVCPHVLCCSSEHNSAMAAASQHCSVHAYSTVNSVAVKVSILEVVWW